MAALTIAAAPPFGAENFSMPQMLHPNGGDTHTRLVAVRDRVRALALAHDWFADALRAAFPAFVELSENFYAQIRTQADRERAAVRALLAEGLMYDPLVREPPGRDCAFARVEGLCATGLAARLGRCMAPHRSVKMPKALERQGAAAALAALDRDAEYQASSTPMARKETMAAENRAAKETGTHVDFTFRAVVARGDGWQEPPDPRSLEPAHLGRFCDADYRTICLYRLGGLADTGDDRRLVPRPADPPGLLGELTPVEMAAWAARTTVYQAWVARHPCPREWVLESNPPLLVDAFPPDLAERMLARVEVWVKGEEEKRATLSATSSGVAEPKALPDPTRTVVLWEGAEHNEHNVRLARTRSAYLEAHGDVPAAMAALKQAGNAIGKSTFYDHLNALDAACPGWRANMLVSGASGNPGNGVRVGPHGKSRAKSR